MKDLTTYIGNTDLANITPADMARGLAETVDDASTGTGGNVDFLTFSGKTGYYKYGKDGEEIDPEEAWLVEPSLLFKGWTCWKGNKPVDRVEWSIYDSSKAVAFDDLPDHGPYREQMGEGWQLTLGMMMLRTETMRSVKFGINSVSGRNAVSDLLGKIHERVMAGEQHYPIITIDSEEFEAQGQVNFKPRFDVLCWTTVEGCREFIANNVTLDELIEGKPKPKRVTKKKVTKKKAGRRR